MPLLRHSHFISPPPEDAAESNSPTSILFSPSMLPELLTGLSEEECKSITAHILPHLRRLLCCPLCDGVLLNDPAVVETCGHAFCYDCINTVIEKGCYRVLPGNGEDDETRSKDSGANNDDAKEENGSECGGKDNERKRPRATGRIQRRGKLRRRKLELTCPVCFGPAFKWTLVRVPLIRDVVMEAMNHSVLANALKDGPDSVGVDKAEAHGCPSPFGGNADTTCLLNAPIAEPSSMAADLTHMVDTSSPMCLSATAVKKPGVVPMSSGAFAMDSQQQSMVLIPIPCLSSRTQEDTNVASSEHGEDSIISGVNDVVASHPINDILHSNGNTHNSDGIRSGRRSSRSSSSSSSVRSADLQRNLSTEDMDRDDEKELDDTVNNSVPLHLPDQPPPVEEKSSKSKALQEVNRLVLGEPNDESSRSLARVLLLSPTSSEEQEVLRQKSPTPQKRLTYNNEDFASEDFSTTMGSLRETPDTISSVSTLRLVIDTSVPQEAQFDSVLLSASRLFGAVVHADERACNEEKRNMSIQAPPLRTIERNIRSSRTQESGKYPKTSPLHWIELHYLAMPMMSTHCIAGFHLERDGAIVSVVTPTIASALVTRSAVVSWTWLADSVAAQRLLPAVTYMQGDALRAQGDLHNSRPGQWMSQGYGFLVLPDDQLHQLLFEDSYAGGPIGRVTDGFDNQSWRRLVLLSGGAWLCPSENCFGALVKHAMGVHEATSDLSIWEAVTKATNASEEPLWRAECCPGRAGDLLLHSIVVLRATVPMGSRSDVNESRMSRFVKAISELFDVAVTDPQNRIDTSSRVQFGRKEDNSGVSPLSPTTPTQCTFPTADDEGGNANIKVEVRCCRWLLKNIVENRQTPADRRQHHSRDVLGGSTGFSGGAVFQQLLYDV